MQRYRVNYRLLIGLAVTSLAVVVASYFLWVWQVNRNADYFRKGAEEAAAEGNDEKAFELLYKYIQLRDEEIEPRIELAQVALRLLKSPSSTSEIRGQSYVYLQEAVRRTNDSELRLELAKFQEGIYPQQALVQVEELLRDQPNNSELLEMQAQLTSRVKGKKDALALCYQLVGYDKNKDEFDSEKSRVKDRPNVYMMLASLILQADRDDEELASSVIDQMLVLNPDSAKAHLNHSIFLRMIDKKEEADAELEKAYAIDPDDLNILNQMAIVAQQNEDYELAEQTIRTAIKKHPDAVTLYGSLAEILIKQQKYSDALTALDEGEKQLGDSRNIGFARLRLETLFAQSDYDGIDKELERVEQMRVPDYEPYIQFNRARILWHKQKWFAAAKALKAVRENLVNFPKEQAICGAMLAASYEKQGKYDLTYRVYQEVVDKFPNYEAAKQGLAVAKSRLNISEDTQGRDLEKAIQDMAALPEDQQDWTGIVEQVDQLAEKRDLPESRVLLIKAQIMMRRGMYAEAEELLRKAAEIDPEDINVYYAAISLLMLDPNKGNEVAYKSLDHVEEKFGDSSKVRITRAEILRELNPPEVVEKLEALAENMDAFSDQEKARVESGVALQLERLGHVDEANVHWKRSTGLNASSLPIYMHIFTVALRNQDPEGMRAAEQKVLDFVQNENDANYILCKVQRMIWEYTQQKLERDAFIQARQLLDVALKSRPEWADLHVLYGRVLLILEEDTDLVLRHLDDALKYGPANTGALGLQVTILARRGNFEQAYDKMQLIPVAARQNLLGRAEAELLLQHGDSDLAYYSAQKLSEKQPNNPSTQTWFADIAMRTEHLDEASKALTKATKLQPRDLDIWLKLIGNYVQLKNNAAIEKALHEAQLHIEADMLPLFTAKKYELLGDWQTAEKIYKGAFSPRIDEMPIARRMAEFYLLWAKQGKVDPNRANPYINMILKQAYDGKADRNDPYVVWARDKAVRILADTGDYQDFLKAERLLNPDDDTTKLGLKERSLLAEILSARPEPESQHKALVVLSEMHRRNEISKEGLLELAKLQSLSNHEDESQRLLVDAIAKYNNDEQLMAYFVDLLIERGEYTTANNRLNRFRTLYPKSNRTVPLSLKLAARSSNGAKLQDLLSTIVPSLDKAPSKEQLGTIINVARLLTQYDQIEQASKLYSFYIRLDRSRIPEYTRFLARHGDPQQAMDLVRQQYPDDMDNMIRIALGMLRERRAEVEDTFDEQIEEMIARALRDDPESISRMMTQAELWEIEGKYGEAIDAYDRLLERNDLTRTTRAAVMNNLGFILALKKTRLGEAEELITKAIEIYGPASDILDTRAIVRMAGKNYDGAAQDMLTATEFSDDPVKFYHSAQANMLAGNVDSALKAWDRALALGIEKAQVPIAEQADFDQVREQIEGLRTQSAGL